MKLLLFPLAFLLVFAVLSQMGLGTIEWESIGALTGYTSAANGWYDSTDHLVAYANGTYAGEIGNITHLISAGSAGPWNDAPFWTNSSGNYNVYDSTGARMLPNAVHTEFNLWSSLGLVAVIGGAIILATLLGSKVVDSTIGGGTDESTSIIIKGTVLLTIWGIFSVLAVGMITQIPLLGPIFYFFITAIYCLGVVNQVGHPGED